MNRLGLVVACGLLSLCVSTDALAGWDESSRVPLKRLYATGQVRLTSEPCPRLAPACADVGVRPVTIYLPASVPAKERAATYYHELGHAFDVLLLTDADRGRLQRLMRNTDLSWSPGDEIEVPLGVWITAEEQFAEAFRLCAQLGPRSRSDLIQMADYDWTPTIRQQQRVCREIIRLARSR